MSSARVGNSYISGNFLASKFSIKIDNNASNKLYIQGATGAKVKDSQAVVYTYEIEFPIILGINGVANDYKALHTYFINIINNQYQALQSDTSIDYTASFIENYKMNFNESECTFQVTIISDSKLNITANLIGSLNYNNLYGRLLRNYDVLTSLAVADVKLGSTFYLGPENGVFVKQANFDIKFEFDQKFFLNSTYTGATNLVYFLIKNYDVTQNISLVGLDDNLFPAYFAPGEFDVYNFNSVIAIGNVYNIWLQFNLNGYLKSEILNLAANNLVETKFDFSLYGVTNYQSGGTLVSTNII